MGVWVHQYIPNGYFFTGTYTDKEMGARRIRYDWSLLNDFDRVLKEIRFQGLYFVAVDNPGDGFPHVHAIVQDSENVQRLGPRWGVTRGGYKIELAGGPAYFYAAKYAVRTNQFGDSRYRENFKPN